ncbi:hypothetical protein FFF34_002835 [Inquilinus sp. KBS0705]|nr:hypothetical protein FFF34_002835 [Inquilinus sp. KBS0705]
MNSLKNSVVDLAKKNLSDHLNDAIQDGHAIINGLEGKIQEWTQLYEAGDIDEGNLKSLILGEKDLMKMELLKQEGLALIRIDKFRIDVCNLVLDAVTSVL